MKEKWDNGIPNYTSKDLMTDDEIFDMGIETIRNYLKKEGFVIKIEMPESDSIINFLAERNDKLFGIFIKTDIAPNIPVISDLEKQVLINRSKEKNAIPLFASVGFGSVDPERFDKGLALKGDGYYCRFNGFEEIRTEKSKSTKIWEEIGLTEEEYFEQEYLLSQRRIKRRKEGKNMKIDESILNKIADIYIFDNTSDFGFYNSYRNFCLDNIVRLNFVYGSKNVRVNSTPEKYILSDTKSNEIKTIFNEYYNKLHEIDKSEIDNVKKYFLIVFVNGDKAYFDYNDDFNQIFTFNKSDTISGTPNVISTPYLVFENSNESNKYRIINEVGISIKNKEFSNIYRYLSDNCIVSYNHESISGVSEIKKEIKNRSGFLNSKLKKIKFYNNIMGYINNNESDICLKIEFTDEHYKTTKYLLYFQFNKANLIEKIEIELFDENVPMKMIFDEGLDRLLNSRYNDFKNN